MTIAKNHMQILKDNLSSWQDQLSKQLWTVIDRTLSAARSNPTQIVTAMRIIEREERYLLFKYF